MGTYVNINGVWTELTGTDRPNVKVSGSWYGVSNIYAKVAGSWLQVYQYDNVPPTIPAPTAVNAATQQTVSWSGITDDASGVASATLYQRFVGTTTGDVAGSSYVLASFSASSTTMAVPTNRRKQGSGESWTAYYYIVAADNAGNVIAGPNSTSVATSPYDIVLPTVPTPTVVNAATQQTVSWTAITDDNTGVASATLYQRFVGTVSGDVAGSSYALAAFGASSTTMSVPTSRRKQGSGESWSAYYYIVATDNAGNSKTGSNSISTATSPYDIVGPTVPTPTVVSGGGSDTISWATVTDDNTGVASATLYQAFHNVTAGTYENKYASYSLGTGGFGSTTMTIPTARRNGTGDHYQVYYWISATDNAGNKIDGDQVGIYSPFVNTKPLGTFYFSPSSANTRNIGDTAWLNPTTEGMVGVSTTRLYGCWFYGTDTIKNLCKGWDANSGTIFVKRCSAVSPTDPNRGNTGTFYLMTHDLGSATTAATFGGTVLEQYLSGDSASAYKALDSTAISRLRSGAGQGFGLQSHSFPPGFLLGMRDFSGMITLVYS